jgi:glycosyltransferase involved in cell wall biosynthesis
MQGLVSVLIPTYNRAYCLGRAIDSALAQTYPHVEVLVVDDGSTDATPELVWTAYGSDPRVRYLPKRNGGVSSARNHGLREARGDYVAFLDSDDVWKPWKLQAQLACLARLPAAGMIWSDMEAVGPDGKVREPRYLRTMYHAYRFFRSEDLYKESYPAAEVVPALRDAVGDARLYAGTIYAQMFAGNLVHTSTAVIRRERLEKVKAFREDYATGEDYEFHFRTCREGPVAFLDVPTIQYQVGLADRLTRFTGDTAVNYLKTITAALARRDHGIDLPEAMIRRILAGAHSWVGAEFAREGDFRRARRHLARSLAYRPWQPRVLAELALCLLPSGLDDGLRGAYRGLKACLRRLRPA